MILGRSHNQGRSHVPQPCRSHTTSRTKPEQDCKNRASTLLHVLLHQRRDLDRLGLCLRGDLDRLRQEQLFADRHVDRVGNDGDVHDHLEADGPGGLRRAALGGALGSLAPLHLARGTARDLPRQSSTLPDSVILGI